MRHDRLFTKLQEAWEQINTQGQSSFKVGDKIPFKRGVAEISSIILYTGRQKIEAILKLNVTYHNGETSEMTISANDAILRNNI